MSNKVDRHTKKNDPYFELLYTIKYRPVFVPLITSS